jgi:hypothetical protein
MQSDYENGFVSRQKVVDTTWNGDETLAKVRLSRWDDGTGERIDAILADLARRTEDLETDKADEGLDNDQEAREVGERWLQIARASEVVRAAHKQGTERPSTIRDRLGPHYNVARGTPDKYIAHQDTTPYTTWNRRFKVLGSQNYATYKQRTDASCTLANLRLAEENDEEERAEHKKIHGW